VIAIGIGPRKIFDSSLKKAAGLDDAGLVDKIYQWAQRSGLRKEAFD
jgi:hypothetical protein